MISDSLNTKVTDPTDNRDWEHAPDTDNKGAGSSSTSLIGKEEKSKIKLTNIKQLTTTQYDSDQKNLRNVSHQINKIPPQLTIGHNPQKKICQYIPYVPQHINCIPRQYKKHMENH